MDEAQQLSMDQHPGGTWYDRGVVANNVTSGGPGLVQSKLGRIGVRKTAPARLDAPRQLRRWCRQRPVPDRRHLPTAPTTRPGSATSSCVSAVGGTIEHLVALQRRPRPLDRGQRTFGPGVRRSDRPRGEGGEIGGINGGVHATPDGYTCRYEAMSIGEGIAGDTRFFLHEGPREDTRHIDPRFYRRDDKASRASGKDLRSGPLTSRWPFLLDSNSVTLVSCYQPSAKWRPRTAPVGCDRSCYRIEIRSSSEGLWGCQLSGKGIAGVLC